MGYMLGLEEESLQQPRLWPTSVSSSGGKTEAGGGWVQSPVKVTCRSLLTQYSLSTLSALYPHSAHLTPQRVTALRLWSQSDPGSVTLISWASKG